jgi:hypothetical protein
MTGQGGTVSRTGVQASELLTRDATAVFATLSSDEWQQPSASAGWRVQDVVVHLATFFNLIADPGSIDLPADLASNSERLNDALVNQRREWDCATALAYYEAQAAAALPQLEAVQAPELAEIRFGGGDIGSHPVHTLSDAVAFDHLTHLTFDLLAPHGPITRPAIVIDEVRMTPALDWMVGGLPQMCGADLAEVLTRPVEIVLDGPGSRRFLVVPDSSGAVPVAIEAALGQRGPDAVVSSTVDFLGWATRRTPWWRSAVRVSGDERYVADVLNRINII